MIKKTKLHPDGDESVTLYPETSADQIPDLVNYLNSQGISAKPFVVGVVTTLPAGSKATVSFTQQSEAIAINFGIPQGKEGQKGEQGQKGDQGLIGAVGPEGPRGPQGPKGPQGIQGIQGIQGEAGANGRSFQITGQVNSVDELPTASTPYIGLAYYVGKTAPRDIYACVDNGGTLSWENQGKLQGPEGPIGPQGPQGPQGVEGPEGPAGEEGRAGNGIIGATTISYTEGTGPNAGYTETTINIDTDEETMPIKVYAKNGSDGTTAELYNHCVLIYVYGKTAISFNFIDTYVTPINKTNIFDRLDKRCCASGYYDIDEEGKSVQIVTTIYKNTAGTMLGLDTVYIQLESPAQVYEQGGNLSKTYIQSSAVAITDAVTKIG